MVTRSASLLAREAQTRIRALREEQTKALVGAFCAEPKNPVARLSRKKNKPSVEAIGDAEGRQRVKHETESGKLRSLPSGNNHP
jgi:hypothetical protein